MGYCIVCGKSVSEIKKFTQHCAVSYIIFCENCGEMLENDSIKQHTETREHRYTETIIDGYKCPNCGFDEDY